MNIFVLDSNLKKCAEYHANRHVVKMIIEYNQLLCSAHWLTDSEAPYKLTHKNHPCAIWTRECIENYIWLADLCLELCKEYTYRYGKKHATIEKCFFTLQSPPHGLRTWDWTKPPSAMDESYIISDDPIVNYRNYYKYGKTKLHAWKNRDTPVWIL
jgi:hypothetical protein